MKESITSFRRSLDIAEDLPDIATIAGAAGWMGRSYVAQGEVAQAVEIMEAAKALLSARGSNFVGYAYLSNGLAEAYLGLAEQAQGEARQVWLEKAESESQNTLKVIRSSSSSVLPDALMVKGRHEWLNGKPAEAQRTWQRAMVKARDFGDPYLQGMIHLEIGRRMGDREHLQRAESILEAISAEFDLAAAREAMKNLQDS